MFKNRLRRYAGLIVLMSTLIISNLVVVVGGAVLQFQVVQREGYARSKMLNYIDMVNRFGMDDQTLRDDIHEHLRMFRDGDTLKTPFGQLQWEYPPIEEPEIRAELDKAIAAYESGDWPAFEQASGDFDDAQSVVYVDLMTTITISRYIAALVMFAAFVWMMILLFFRLGRSDDRALAVSRENEHILASTKEGMFLIDENYRIGEQRSSAVKEIFGDNIELDGNFLDFIRKYIAEEDFEHTQKFLGLLFGGRVKPRLMGDLNPLRSVEVIIEKRLGGRMRKVLSFDFSLDEQADEGVTDLLVTISDITKEAVLREELESTKEIQNERLALIRGLLHIEPAQLRDFFERGTVAYEKVNDLLTDVSGDHEGYLDSLTQIARIIHRLKGDAAAMRLQLFETSLHRFEDSIDEIRKLNSIDGESLLTLVVQLKNMIAELELAKSMTSHFGSAAAAVVAEPQGQAATDTPPTDEFSAKLGSLAGTVASRAGKQVKLNVEGVELLDDRPTLKQDLYDIAVQLVRNSVVHGIEKPNLRGATGKDATGIVNVVLRREGDKLRLSVKDDGQGIQFDKIKQKALEQGFLKAEDEAGVDAKTLYGFLFMAGFSSADSVSEDAGRGVGLDAVRDQITALGGRISARTSVNKYTEFVVDLPMGNDTPKTA